MSSYKVMCALTLLTLLTPVCGKAELNSKIVGGQDAFPGSWPWQATLIIHGNSICGGSLISNEWVLTAAHCFPSTDTNNVFVYLGRQTLFSPNSNMINRTVTQIIKHPNYNHGARQDNDITLLKLSSPVNFTNYILPVCLAASDSTYYNGTNVWITGWGVTEDGELSNNLREAEVTIVGNRQCKCDYGFTNITDNMMCAGLRAGGKDTCQGDSGGPLVVKQNARWVQGGITSFGKGCGLPKYPGVYTRVSQYQSWINSQITNNQPGFVTFTSSGTDSDLNNTCPTVSPIVALPPLPTAELCGKSPINTRIVGGQDAPTGHWPWNAYVFASVASCQGSLINNQWVLTAAHCFSSNDTDFVFVILGKQSMMASAATDTFLAVSQIFLHPNYVARTGDNDICLLKLSSPVTFTNYILPVCLAASDSTYHSGTSTWVVGWGFTGIGGLALPNPMTLREVEVPVVGNRQCNCNYGVGTITDNMICAGVPAGGKGPCQGDDGGPLVNKQNSRWILGGVVSSGSDCGKPNLPGVFTRVSKYQSWINSHITSDPPGFVTFTSNGTDKDLSVTCPGLPPPPTALLPTTTAKSVVCGQAPLNSRIGGGSSVATAGGWPWMASLQKDRRHVCGGTLVALDFVVSSADCFLRPPTASDWTVVLGRLKQNCSNPFEETLKVTKIDLTNQTGSNVAVLHLATQPTLSSYIQPICVDNGRTFSVGSTCWAAGWSSGAGGVEQVLQEIQTSVVDCGNTSSDSICVEAFTMEQGLSGGPLMCRQDGSWFQAAVLTVDSTTHGQADVMLFIRLKHYEIFLLQTLGTFLPPASTITTSTNTTNTTTLSTSSRASAQKSSFVLFHLTVFSMCLYYL
ncbi:hypothetical protein Q5P01_003159 [Channa striata]|uniref:Peptidase S1 domain-containing protein n=1 Tax=Channa striata TaxID=64152 RepID=A0AA88T4G3_CHASR|nr:hypothetical protein Q5P01_003159 [Channa striata]